MKKLRIFLPAAAVAMLLTASCGMLNKFGVSGKTFTFKSLPQNIDELKALPFADFSDPYAVVALTMAALTRYKTSSRDCYQMLNYLKGPGSLSGFESNFIRDRLEGKGYIPFSFFEGATPANNYTPKQPYRISIEPTPYSFREDGWCTLYVRSGGADSPRPIKLRQKKSTGEWFLNDIQCLAGIRLPAAEDKWY